MIKIMYNNLINLEKKIQSKDLMTTKWFLLTLYLLLVPEYLDYNATGKGEYFLA